MAPAMSKMSKLRVLAATAAVMASTNCTEFQPRPAPVDALTLRLTTTSPTASTTIDKEMPTEPNGIANFFTGGHLGRKHKKAMAKSKWEADQKAAAEKTAAELEAQAEQMKKDAVIKTAADEVVSRAIENVLAGFAEEQSRETQDDVEPEPETIMPNDNDRLTTDEIQQAAAEAAAAEAATAEQKRLAEAAEQKRLAEAAEQKRLAEAAEQKRTDEAFKFALEKKYVKTHPDFTRKIDAGELSVAKLLEEKNAAAAGKEPVPESDSCMTLCGKILLWIFGSIVFMLSILFGRVLCSRKSDEDASESEMEDSDSDSEAEGEARSRAESMSP